MVVALCLFKWNLFVRNFALTIYFAQKKRITITTIRVTIDFRIDFF